MVDLFDNGSNLLDGAARWIVELPVDVPLPWKHRTGIAAAHGDNDISRASSSVSAFEYS